MWGWICLFPADVALRGEIVRLHGSRRFGNVSLIQTPCLMCIAIGTTVEEVNVCHLSKRVVFGLHHESNTSTHTSTVPSWVHLAMAFMVPLSVHVILLTYCSLDTSCCIPFRTLSITHSSVFLVDHNNSRISTQQWISRNLFTFGPMFIGTFLLN